MIVQNTKKAGIDDLIHVVSFHPNKRKEFFLSLTDKQRADVLIGCTKHVRQALLSLLSAEQCVDVLEELDPDEATDLLQLMPYLRRTHVLKKLSSSLKDSVEVLSQFDPQSAAGLMTLDYVQVQPDEKVSDVAEHFRVHEKRTGKSPVIVVMQNGILQGTIPGHELALAKPSQKAAGLVHSIPTVHHNASQKQVVSLFRSHPHNKVAVIGDTGNIMGIIYSDDVLKLIQRQASSSLYDFAGVHEEESVADTALLKVHFRYKWLVVNLATAFLAAFTVSLFQGTIAKYVLLAVYMPIVAGMGGNAATQTLAVMVRGISLNQVDAKSTWIALRREIVAGFLNGLINGAIVAVIVLVFNHDVKIALILAIAMVINLMVAGIFGTIVPAIMERLGKDPASSATVFITTATDVLGFLAFLGLAKILL